MYGCSDRVHSSRRPLRSQNSFIQNDVPERLFCGNSLQLEIHYVLRCKIFVEILPIISYASLPPFNGIHCRQAEIKFLTCRFGFLKKLTFEGRMVDLFDTFGKRKFLRNGVRLFSPILVKNNCSTFFLCNHLMISNLGTCRSLMNYFPPPRRLLRCLGCKTRVVYVVFSN